MAAPVLQFKRGLLANLPGLRVGEPGFTTDSYDLYVGIDSTTTNNKFFGSHRYWTKGTASTGSGVNFVEGTTNGTQYITLKGPDNLSGITTYTFPATPTADYFLKTNASGDLSWAAVTLNSFAGIVTFTDTTDNTLGNANTGSVQFDGGVGIEKNLTVGGNLNVQGYSEFVGVATFKGGTINLGDSTGDDINVGGEFVSGLFPNTTATYDLGDGSRQWRHGNFSGIVTASAGAVIDALRIGITATNEIDTSSGALILDSASGQTTIDDNLSVTGIATVTGAFVANGNVTLGDAAGDTVTVNGTATFGQTITGTISTATRATLVDTTSTTTNASYYVPFVDTLGGENGETLRVGIGLSINPSTGAVGVASVLSVGTGTNSYIKAGGGSNAMFIYSNGNVSFQGTIGASQINGAAGNKVVGLAGSDASFVNNVSIAGIATVGTGVGITQFSSSVSTGTSTSSVPTSSAVINYVGTQIAAVDLTTGIAGDSGTGTVNTSQTLTVAGTAGEIETSASSQTITIGLPNTVIVGTALSAPTLLTATLQHRNGTQAATIDTSGNITASQNLTVTGNLYVNGSTTQVNTSSMTVEDRTIELGQVDGSAPSSATTWDLGVLFNYNSSGAKKSGVIWEHASGRFKFGSQVSDGGGTDNDSPQITITDNTGYASIEIKSLWINDCAGTHEVISCSGTTRSLNDITIDCGTF
jgi:hypothetical protein